MVRHNIADGQQKGYPVFIERDDDYDHKEVKVHLNIAAREVHEHTRRGDQTKACNTRANSPGQVPQTCKGGGQSYEAAFHKAVYEPSSHDQPETYEAERMEPEQDDNTPVSPSPELVRQRPSFRQAIPSPIQESRDTRRSIHRRRQAAFRHRIPSFPNAGSGIP